MKMIQLYLVTICILLSPPLTTSEVVVSSSPTPNVTSMATVNTKAGLTNQMNSSLQPRLPTETLCDVNKASPCQSGLICENGKCSCPGSSVYSLAYQKCKIRAGGFGCTKSGDCIDGAHCFHPAHRRCNHFRCHQYGGSEPTVCDCKCAPLEGINGFCNSFDANTQSCDSSHFIKSSAFTMIIIYAISFLIL